MSVTAAWTGGAAFTVRTGSGHDMSVDGPPAIGGANKGARPMELLLASVATCSGIDVVNILAKGRREFSSVRVAVSGRRAEGVPAVFTDITLRFEVDGADPAHVRRAAALTVEKYCSALKMVERAARIDWEVIGAGTDA